MKTKLSVAILALVSALAMLVAGPGENRTTLSLVWDPDPENDLRGGVDATCVYWSTNQSIPLTNWVKVGTVVGTTNRWAITNVNILTGPHYYFVTASNVVGESIPSNVACLPAPPRPNTGLKLLSL